MTLVVLTVAVIALLIAVLAIFLFVIGMLLNRTADNLDDCVQNVKNIVYQAEVVGPAIERINETGTTVVGALPLLCEAAERIGVAKSAPYVDPSETPYSAPSVDRSAAPPAAPSVDRSATPPAAAHSAAHAAVPAASPQGVGYLDEDRGNLGYLDA
jgi:HAMP domain-containing protein